MRFDGTTISTGCIMDRVIWGVSILWATFQTSRVYKIYHYEIGPVHSKLSSNVGDAAGPPKRPATVASRDTKITVDPKTAASVANTAYTSGAAGQLAKGAIISSGGHSFAANGKMVKILNDFTGQEPGDLTVKVGDQVSVVRQGNFILNLIVLVDENWLEGTLNGETGIFPANFASAV
jgi:Variant SH3 domain